MMDGIIPLGCGLRRKGLGKSYGREHRSKTKKKTQTNKLQKEHKNGKKTWKGEEQLDFRENGVKYTNEHYSR